MGVGSTRRKYYQAADASFSRSQREVIEVVKETPGCTIRFIANRLSRPYSTVRSQVKRLEKVGLITWVREGRELRIMMATGISRALMTLAPLHTDPRKRRILDYSAERSKEFISINQIANDLDMEFGFVKRTLEILDKTGAIRLAKRDTRYMIEMKHIPDAIDMVESTWSFVDPESL